MLEPLTYLCGVVTEPYNALYEVTALSSHHAAEEYCLMYEGGWDNDHFNLTQGEPRVIQVNTHGDRLKHTVSFFQVTLAEDCDQEYVIEEAQDDE